MSKDPRVAPVVPGTRPELAQIERDIAAERGRIMLLYQVLLNSAPLAEGWEKLLTAIRNRSAVPPSLREMVILRVAVLNRAPYEFAQHEPVAKRAGVSDAKIEALRAPALGDAFDEDERAVLALTDTMTRNVQVDDATIAPVLARYDARVVVEIVATIAVYNMVSRFLEALRIGH
jgi:4-carboxymuconolactone decarboxylase